MKKMQNKDLQNKIAELDEANAKRSEATIALARHVSMHKEECAMYERQLVELRDKSQQSVDVLRAFIHENLAEALDNSPQGQIEDVLQVFMERGGEAICLSSHAASALYDEVQQALNKVSSERNNLRDVCTQQMATIREQSQELDSYIGRMARVIGLVQETEKANGRLKKENMSLRKQVEALANAAEMQKLDKEKVDHSKSSTRALEGYMDNDIWARDAEITNLRRKLEQAFNRERQLDHQLKQLVQSSQAERTDKRPNRFKRLLTGSSNSQDHLLMLPKGNSMLDLSYASLLPTEKLKSRNGEPPSPTKSGGTSPTMLALRELNPTEPLELPLPHQLQDERSLIDLPSRLRAPASAFNNQLPHHDEIESAITSRFQLPANVHSTASSARPFTPKSQSSSSNSISLDDMQSYSHPRTKAEAGTAGMSLPRSLSMVFDEYDYAQLAVGHQRVLSGITEVSETGTVECKYKSGGSDGADRRMYQNNVDALSKLEMQ